MPKTAVLGECSATELKLVSARNMQKCLFMISDVLLQALLLT